MGACNSVTKKSKFSEQNTLRQTSTFRKSKSFKKGQIFYEQKGKYNNIKIAF